jgi:hypothetical protein
MAPLAPQAEAVPKRWQVPSDMQHPAQIADEHSEG